MTVVKNYSHTCVPHILVAPTIRGQRLFHSELPVVWLLFEGGIYSEKYRVCNVGMHWHTCASAAYTSRGYYFKTTFIFFSCRASDCAVFVMWAYTGWLTPLSTIDIPIIHYVEIHRRQYLLITVLPYKDSVPFKGCAIVFLWQEVRSNLF